MKLRLPLFTVALSVSFLFCACSLLPRNSGPSDAQVEKDVLLFLRTVNYEQHPLIESAVPNKVTVNDKSDDRITGLVNVTVDYTVIDDNCDRDGGRAYVFAPFVGTFCKGYRGSNTKTDPWATQQSFQVRYRKFGNAWRLQNIG